MDDPMTSEKRCGIVLAGGSGTRLHPMTKVVSKQLIPVYDKPMIYYPISTLMQAGIRDVLIITTPADQTLFERLLGDGPDLGMRFEYRVQPSPDGLAQAFIIGDSFIQGRPSALVLGDNIFHGADFDRQIRSVDGDKSGAVVFACEVRDPERYGVVAFDDEDRAVDLEEKPDRPKSNHAVTGLYFYDATVVERAASLKPSSRGELEITDLNRTYLKDRCLHVVKLARGTAWLDTGTSESLLQASQFVETLETRQGIQVGCLEEIAWRSGWIDDAAIERAGEAMAKNPYGQYLLGLVKNGR